MKLRLSLILGLLFVFQLSFATPVSEQEAYRRAEKYFAAIGGGQPGEVRFINYGYRTDFGDNLYIFVAEGRPGFVIVPRWECGREVLAYSAESTFDLPMNPAVIKWLEDCDEAVYLCRNLNFKPSKDGDVAPYSVVGPLLNTQWSQKPLYNNECPVYEGMNCVTGCVATAMAQVMRYWRYPAMGQGTHSYDENRFGTLTVDYGAATYNWDNMPRVLNNRSAQSEVDEVAKLMYHCGVSVDMAYGTGTSGALSSLVPNAMHTYFGYDAGIREIFKDTIADQRWKDIMHTEIAAGRPVIYSGNSEEYMGHAFIIDGYDSFNSFHINWGWGGSFDGYYAIGALNPMGSGTGGNANNDYNYFNSAIIGIQPTVDVLTLTVPRTELSRWGDTLVCWMRTGASLSQWAISDNSDGWLTLNTDDADDRKLVRFTVVADRNTTGAPRTATLTVRHGEEVVSVVLTQEDASPSADGCYGNQLEGYAPMAQIMPGEMFIIRPEALGNFVDGQRVVSFSFGTGSYGTFNGRDFNIEIYEGSVYSETLDNTAVDAYGAQHLGTLVYSQPYTATADGQHEVTLDEPYNITSGRNFWIAVRTRDTTVFYIDHVYMHDSIAGSDFPVVDSLPKEYLIYRAAVTDGDTGLMIYYSYFSQSGVNLLQYGVLPRIHFCVETVATACEDVHESVFHEYCRPYEWDGVEYNDNLSFVTLREGVVPGGCDSIITDTFALRTGPTIQRMEEVCDTMLPFVWRDTSIYDAATYHFVMEENEWGCDTNLYIQLVINTCVPEPEPTCVDAHDTLEVNSPCSYYDFRGERLFARNATIGQNVTIADAVEGGCDSIYTIYVDANFGAFMWREVVRVCSDSLPYYWHDREISDSGDYYYSYPNSESEECDSVRMLIFSIDTCTPPEIECDTAYVTLSLEGCDSVVWRDNSYSLTDTYEYTAIGSDGCDTIYSINVVVIESPQIDSIVSVCDSAWMFDSLYRITDEYHFVLPAATGCDTVLNITLNVRRSTTETETIGSCGPYTWHDVPYGTSGTYRWTAPEPNMAGCDSVQELRLIIGDNSSREVDVLVCDSMLWNGIMLREDGQEVNAMLLSRAGCDSLVIAHVVLRHNSRGYESAEACGVYLWHGQRLWFSGTTYDTLPNAEGCDSVIALDLTLHPGSQGSLNGIYEVAEGRKVRFSLGNLQYMPAGDAWRFALQQFDVIGSGNSSADTGFVGWIDLFGWATSGYHNPLDRYNRFYMPYSIVSCNVSDANTHGYGPSVTMTYPDLEGMSISYDWGIHNAITNGGNVPGRWRTLTAEEWNHLLFERPDAASKRGMANISGVNGLVVLPDSWSQPIDCSFTPGVNDGYQTNTYTYLEWSSMEGAGALFLPASGMRHDRNVSAVGSNGYYWSATHAGQRDAYVANFDRGRVEVAALDRSVGRAVRLVQDITGTTLPCVTYGDTLITAYGPLTWLGNRYDSTGDYQRVLTAANGQGCDSVVVLHLVIGSPDGIDGVLPATVRVWSYDKSIVIAGAEGLMMTVYDVSGREVVPQRRIATNEERTPIAHQGVYLVKIGTATAAKVVVR